jgi:hypothetical protein
MSEIGAPEGEKSILFAPHESNPSQCSTFLETESCPNSTLILLVTMENKNLLLASYLFSTL